MTKKIIIAIASVVALGVAWYLISPLWRTKQLDEASPLQQESTQQEAQEINDARNTMDAKTQEEFEQQVDAMKDRVITGNQAMPTQAQLLAEGPFIASAHEVAGNALLIKDKGKTVIRFEDFTTINGPDLRIYLAADRGAKDYIDLGPIRATQGNVNYELPAGTDTTKYNKVLVWCRAFRVLFSYAELK